MHPVVLADVARYKIEELRAEAEAARRARLPRSPSSRWWRLGN